ncbi:GNAT family N-acetyltransferase [Candidatus Bathyarchaeota archaeon]|nr:GNAT family N-acetyltransferase [Candidatus Bathyarchaeota archaeon]
MKIEILQPKNQVDIEEYYDLRWRILREPWKQPRGSEKDPLEDESIHIMLRIDRKTVAVGRLHFNSDIEAQIRYMAVELNFQNKGFGTLLIRELEKIAKNKGAHHVILNGRDSVLQFYQKNGYTIVNKAHTIFGCIEHWKMRKDLI